MSNSDPSLPVRVPDFPQLLQDLQPTVQALEKLRADYNRKRQTANNVSLVIGALGGAAAFAALISTNEPVVPIIAAVVTILLIAAIRHIILSNSREIFRSGIKNELYTRVTAAIAPQMVFQPHHYRSETELEQTGLISSRIDRYNGQDQFSGHIGKTPLVFSEVHAERRETSTDSKGRRKTRWVTVFRGIFLTAEFHKHFSGYVLIETDFAESTFGWLGRKMQGLSGDLVRLEHPDFEQAFKVRANDPVEANYLLTPSMQERLLKLRETWGTGIQLSLIAGHVHLLIPQRHDWFECDPDRAADDQHQLQGFSEQLISILQIVEELDLNTRLWTKE